MLRSARAIAQSSPLARKRLFSQASSARARQASQRQTAVVVASAAVVAGSLWYATRDRIHNDAVVNSKTAAVKSVPINGVAQEDGSLATLVWGSNRYVIPYSNNSVPRAGAYRNHLLAPDAQATESIRTPAVADWLQNVALRDLVLHERHAACIDANGDVYQWGDGYFEPGAASSSGKPVLTLRGKV